MTAHADQARYHYLHAFPFKTVCTFVDALHSIAGISAVNPQVNPNFYSKPLRGKHLAKYQTNRQYVLKNSLRAIL